MIRPFARTAILALFPLTSLVPAQDHQPPKPGAEMERLHAFVGHWKGQGTAVAPGMGEVPWQSHEEMTLVLDGFFVQGRSEIQVGAPMPLQFYSLMGWDAPNQRYVTYGLANNGDHQGFETMAWVDDDTLVSTSSKMVQGEPTLSRSTYRFESDDVWSITVEVAVGAGPFEVSVQGDYVRVEKAHAFGKETGFIAGVVPNEMRKLKRMVGHWDQKGWFDFPGMGKMDITGNERIGYGYGGHFVRAVAEGQAGDLPLWTGWSFITWDAEAQSYRLVQFSNMGEVSSAELMWNQENADQLIGISAMRFMGAPMASRSVMTFDDGGIVGMGAHACFGTAAPKQNFEMAYTLRGQ